MFAQKCLFRTILWAYWTFPAYVNYPKYMHIFDAFKRFVKIILAHSCIWVLARCGNHTHTYIEIKQPNIYIINANSVFDAEFINIKNINFVCAHNFSMIRATSDSTKPQTNTLYVFWAGIKCFNIYIDERSMSH